MLKHAFRAIVAHLAVGAALHLAAATAAAQSDVVLSARDLRDVSAPHLYDAIAQLRPHWLPGAGDPAGAAGGPRVVVYLNGRHTGDVRVLHDIPTGEVTRAHVRSAEYVRRTDPRFPREEFDLAIYVVTRAAPRRSPQGRVTVSLDAGFNPRSLGHVMDDALAGAGYRAKFATSETGIVRFDDEGTPFPPSVGATINYGLRGLWGLAATAQHTPGGWTGGYNPETGVAVSADLASTEGALLVTREAGVVRAGVGPAYRHVKWEWSRGFCQCAGQQTTTGGAPGVAAEALTELPLSGRLFPAFRLLARYYPSQNAEYESLEQPVDTGGLVVTFGVSLATRF
jgi:hypothetical protein